MNSRAPVVIFLMLWSFIQICFGLTDRSPCSCPTGKGFDCYCCQKEKVTQAFKLSCSGKSCQLLRVNGPGPLEKSFQFPLAKISIPIQPQLVSFYFSFPSYQTTSLSLGELEKPP